MEIVIIVGAIGSVIAYICLSTKTQGEIATKRNPGFKSSLRHNPDQTSPEKVFRVLKENNINPCFLDTELKKQDNIPLVDTSIYTAISTEQKCDNSFVEERTQKIFERLNHCISSNGLIDATKLAYSFGFEIVEHNGLPDLLNGMITCDCNGNQMAINDNLSKEQKRLAPYIEQAKMEQKLKKQLDVSDMDVNPTSTSQEIKIDNQYITYKDSYTYRQILIGLRNEFLEFQKKLDQLSEYVFMFEDTVGRNFEKRDEYYFNLYKNPLENKNPELVLDRTIIRKRLLEMLRLSYSPTRAFMVKNNNGVYHPLRKHWFEEYQFNMVIKPGCEKEFQECAEEILNSDFAKYMMQLNSNISAVTCTPIIHKQTPIIVPNITSFGFCLRTNKSEIKYLGRNNMIEFRSIRTPKGKWEPLTQEHLDFVSRIEFSKDDFSEYHQGLIEKSIDDDRPIVLSEEYQPEILTKFEIQDSPKQLVLTKTQSKRNL